MSDRRLLRRPADPGADWARDLLAPLRDHRIDLDIAPAVMRRIAGEALAPAPAPLPGAWPQVAWAAALFAGFAVLALLVAAAGVMVVNGDEGVRTAVVLAAAAAKVTLRGFDHMAGVIAAFAGAGLAFFKAAWAMLDALSPVVRGGALAGAAAGLASIGASIVIFSRARRAAPAAQSTERPFTHGGLS